MSIQIDIQTDRIQTDKQTNRRMKLIKESKTVIQTDKF